MNKESHITERRKQIQLAIEKFVSLIRDANGVIEVALFGSAASEKDVPQDFDLMVFIEDTECISHVSKSIRKTSHLFHAHDVFVFDKNRNYLGRICQRGTCPTSSVECYVRDCGKIQYLKQIKGFAFKEREALIRKPVIIWLNPAQNESISQQWFNEFVSNQRLHEIMRLSKNRQIES